MGTHGAGSSGANGAIGSGGAATKSHALDEPPQFDHYKHHVGVLHDLTDCKSTRHYGELNRYYKELFVSPFIVAKLIQRGSPTQEDLAWATALCCVYVRIRVNDDPEHISFMAQQKPNDRAYLRRDTAPNFGGNLSFKRGQAQFPNTEQYGHLKSGFSYVSRLIGYRDDTRDYAEKTFDELARAVWGYTCYGCVMHWETQICVPAGNKEGLKAAGVKAGSGSKDCQRQSSCIASTGVSLLEPSAPCPNKLPRVPAGALAVYPLQRLPDSASEDELRRLVASKAVAPPPPDLALTATGKPAPLPPEAPGPRPLMLQVATSECSASVPSAPAEAPALASSGGSVALGFSAGLSLTLVALFVARVGRRRGSRPAGTARLAFRRIRRDAAAQQASDCGGAARKGVASREAGGSSRELR